MRLMEANLCGVYTTQIKSKADLMKYCLEGTVKKTKYGCFAGYNLKRAQELFDFFLKNVNLPDVEPPVGAELSALMKSILAEKGIPVASS